MSFEMQRDGMSYCAHYDQRTHTFHTSRLISTLLQPVLDVKPETVAKDETDAPPLRMYGENGVKGTFVKPAVKKELSVEGPVSPPTELCVRREVEKVDVDCRETNDRSHICCPSLMRRVRQIMEKHVIIFTDTLGAMKPKEHPFVRLPETWQTRQEPYR